ncbi:MAG: methionyl-tRNA formyltransferase, partial [Candidatus Kryptoniota bacterium]
MPRIEFLNLGFIGSGHWGMFYLGLTELQSLLKEVLISGDIDRHSIKNLYARANVNFYSSKGSYFTLTQRRFDAIIVAGWPHKLPGELIGVIDCPIVNIHASLLPRYRGPEPIIQQILHNEDNGGVTLHKLDYDWDSGPICCQVAFKIEPFDNNQTLFLKAARAGRKALNLFLEELAEGAVRFTPQDERQATYYHRLRLADLLVDHSKTREQVDTMHRAF